MNNVVRCVVLFVGIVSLVIFGLRLYDWAVYQEAERRWDEQRGYRRCFDLPWPALAAAVSFVLVWLV